MSRLPEPAPPALSFQYLAEVAVGATTRVDLCRIRGPHREGELAAVKRLHPHLAEDPSVATEFLDEVWMTAALKHPNVVEVAGWGTDHEGTFLAVELVQGVSLARLMKTIIETGEAFPERLVVYIAAQICRGLAAAHGLRSPQGELLNLVHRDLTPGNVLVGFQGEVKIADFGLAKAKLRMTRTLTGTLKGEPTYMAPEQAQGATIDRRADLFSLGVMMFELFAGRHPWAAPTEFEMVRLIATTPPADLRELRPKIDKELVAIVTRCLEKDPAARFQSAEEILSRLEEWLHVHGYLQGSQEALARFVRRNAMRQMRWFERAVAGEFAGPSDALTANRPREVRPPPPRADTYTGGAITVLGPKGMPLMKGQPRPGQGEEERTEITADGDVPGRHDILDEDGPTNSLAGQGEGEEVPTLVNKGWRGEAPRPPQAGAQPHREQARREAPYDTLVDEDSDARTTAIKALHFDLRLPDAPAGAAAPGAPLEMMPGYAESEDLPTQPILSDSGAQPAALLPKPSPAPAPVNRIAPPSPPPPRAATPPGRSAPPPRGAQPGSAPPPPGFRGPPPPRVPGAGSPAASGVLPPAVPPPPRSEPQAAAKASGPASVAAPPLELPGAAPAGADDRAQRPATLLSGPERVAAEAERIAREAARTREEADRMAAAARILSQAALTAAEALRLLSTTGLPDAARRLEDALALERSAQNPASLQGSGRGPLSSSSRPPDPLGLGAADAEASARSAAASAFAAAGSSFPPPPLPESFPPPGSRSAPLGPGASPASVAPGPLSDGKPLVGLSVSPGADPPVPSYLKSRGAQEADPARVPGTGAPPAPPRTVPGLAGVPPSALATGDALAFRSSLQPTLFGMPRAVAVIVGLSVFILVLGLLFLIFS